MSLLSDSANPPEGAPGEALTVAQAADRIANKAVQPEPRERPTAPTADDEQATADQTDGGEPEEGEAPADGEAETEAATSEEDGEDETAEDNDPEVTVKINGKDVKVKLSEALAGYQREADYRQKTAAVAEERRAAEEAKRVSTEHATQVQAERQHLANLATTIEQQILGSLPTEQQLAHLRATDPPKFLLAMEDIRSKAAYVQGLRAQSQQAMQRTQAEAEAARQKAAQQGLEAVAEAIPEFRDPEKRKAVQAKLRTALQRAGYGDTEIAQIVDPRIVRFVHQAERDREDAEAFRALKARNARTEQRVAEAPQVARPGAAVSRTAVADTRVRDLRKQAAKSGNIKDVAAMIAAKSARK